MPALSAGGVMQIFFVCGSVSKNVQHALGERQGGDGNFAVLTFVVVTGVCPAFFGASVVGAFLRFFVVGVSSGRAGDEHKCFAIFAAQLIFLTEGGIKLPSGGSSLTAGELTRTGFAKSVGSNPASSIDTARRAVAAASLLSVFHQKAKGKPRRFRALSFLTLI